MYDYIRGRLVEFHPGKLVIESGGIGFDVTTPAHDAEDFEKIGAEIRTWIYLHQKDEGPALYGFAHKQERELFKLLLKVSGIGPKVAIQILSGIKPEDLVRALADEDWKRLTLISGIGPKTAKRLLVELKERLTDKELLLIPAGAPSAPALIQAYNALMKLGFSPDAVRNALKDLPASDDLEESIRKALTRLSP
ncbi:MAG: Holliday junction branch migration protein RuvA [bacterium]|nr:Holliday junction branch migration protein RuvA [bacterium]